MVKVVDSIRLKEVIDDNGNKFFELEHKEVEISLIESNDELTIVKSDGEWEKSEIIK